MLWTGSPKWMEVTIVRSAKTSYLDMNEASAE
jgi:hypothetical protein